MNRPEIIYLPEPITIEGIQVHHTLAGLNYLIDHYQTVLNIATPKQMSNECRTHIEQTLIINFKLHIVLYERNPITP